MGPLAKNPTHSQGPQCLGTLLPHTLYCPLESAPSEGLQITHSTTPVLTEESQHSPSPHDKTRTHPRHQEPNLPSPSKRYSRSLSYVTGPVHSQAEAGCYLHPQGPRQCRHLDCSTGSPRTSSLCLWLWPSRPTPLGICFQLETQDGLKDLRGSGGMGGFQQWQRTLALLLIK